MCAIYYKCWNKDLYFYLTAPDWKNTFKYFVTFLSSAEWDAYEYILRNQLWETGLQSMKYINLIFYTWKHPPPPFSSLNSIQSKSIWGCSRLNKSKTEHWLLIPFLQCICFPQPVKLGLIQKGVWPSLGSSARHGKYERFGCNQSYNQGPA